MKRLNLDEPAPETRSEASKRLWTIPEYRERLCKSLKEAAIRRWAGHQRKPKSDKPNPKAAKLTDEEVREVRVRLAEGERVGDVAWAYGVSSTIISFIKSGRTYKRVR